MNKIRIGLINRFVSGLLVAVCVVSWHGGPVARSHSFLAARSLMQGDFFVVAAEESHASSVIASPEGAKQSRLNWLLSFLRNPYVPAHELGHVTAALLTWRLPASVRWVRGQNGEPPQVQFHKELGPWRILLVAPAELTLFAASAVTLWLTWSQALPLFLVAGGCLMLPSLFHFIAEIRSSSPRSDGSLFMQALKYLLGLSEHKPLTKFFYTSEEELHRRQEVRHGGKKEASVVVNELFRKIGLPQTPENKNILTYLISYDEINKKLQSIIATQTTGEQLLKQRANLSIDPNITAQQIYEFLLKFQKESLIFPNVETLATLYAEMLRRLKKNWPIKGALSKANICETLFETMLPVSGLCSIPALSCLVNEGENEIRQVNEAACQKLFTLILCHLLGQEGITDLGNQRMWQFRGSSKENPYQIGYAHTIPIFLSKADLSRGDLREADLSYTNLLEAVLSGADLRHANLEAANLIKACLSMVDLRGTRLLKVVLPYADLTGALVTKAQFALRNMIGLTKQQSQSLIVVPDEEPPGAEAHGLVLPLLLALPYLAGGVNSALLQALPLLLGAAVSAVAIHFLYSRLSRLQAALLASGEILRRDFVSTQGDTAKKASSTPNIPIPSITPVETAL